MYGYSLFWFFFFFFNDTATTEIYTLSLHDALPISFRDQRAHVLAAPLGHAHRLGVGVRSEEHTSELQSQSNLVCRLLLEKKKKNTVQHNTDRESLITYPHRLLETHRYHTHVATGSD